MPSLKKRKGQTARQQVMEKIPTEEVPPDAPSEPIPKPPPGGPLIEYNQPRTSPYEYPTATLVIGTREYRISEYYLQKSPQIRMKSTPRARPGEIHLADVDDDIGHTLVHFLCTGKYETLNSDFDHAREYRRSVLVYQAARTYELVDLESVAQKYIIHFSGWVSFRDILHTAREIVPRLPREEHWFDWYLRLCFKRSFLKDARLFHREELTESMGQSTRFDRLLLRLTVEILATRISRLETIVAGEEEPVPEPAHETEPNPVSEPEPVSEPNPVAEPASKPARNWWTESKPASPGYPEEQYPEEPSPAEEDEPAPATRADWPAVKVYNDGVVSPRPLSPVEVSPVAELPVDEAPPEEEAQPDIYGLNWGSIKGKKKKDMSLAVEGVA
ncbi:hypothetical protein BJX99DRAFT_259323 [Aspergillus californicus]